MKESALRRLVATECQILDDSEALDHDHRSSCTVILKAIGDFLISQDQIFADSTITFLRETIVRILEDIGPGDTLFRTEWMIPLSRATSKHSLIFVLEFVPCTIPQQNDDNGLTRQVMDSLKQIAETYPAVLSQIFHCLRKLVSSQNVSKKDVLQFMVWYLRDVPKEDIEDTLDGLLILAGDEDVNWSYVVQALRAEERPDQSIDDDESGYPKSVHRLVYTLSAMIRFYQDQIYEGFFEEYLVTLDDLCATGPDQKLSEQDMMVLLVHRTHKKHDTYVNQILNDAVENDCLDWRNLVSMADLLLTPPHAPNEVTHRLRGIHLDLVWFLTFLCTGPLRNPTIFGVESASSLAVKYGVALMEKSNVVTKDVLLSTLMQLNDECLRRLSQLDSSRMESSEEVALHRVQSDLVEIVRATDGELPAFVKTNLIRTIGSSRVTKSTVTNVCRILIYSNRSEKGDEELLALTRRMLFSSAGRLSDLTDENRECDSKINGLIMMVEMVQSMYCNSNQLSLLWHSLRRVLLPPTDRGIHSDVGTYALKAIRAFHDLALSCDDDKQCVSSADIFSTMTSVLMNARLVQYEKPSDNSVRKEKTTLGYSGRPAFFKVKGAKERTFHKMVFSFDAQLNDQALLSPVRWDSVARWGHDLIDTYLTLGRTKSRGKWIPHAWVEAAFEFPSTGLSSLRATNTRQHRMLEAVRRGLNEYDPCCHSEMSKVSLDKEFVDALKRGKNPVERSGAVKDVLRISISYCLAITLTTGILSNVYAHYSELLDSENEKGNQERIQATRMLQYNLAKMYDLVGKCEMLEAMFRCIASATLRRKRRSRNGNRAKLASPILGDVMVDEAVQVAASILPTMRCSLVSTEEHVRTKILWHCLVDPSNDSLIIAQMRSEFTSSDVVTDRDSFDIIVNLRLNILEQLTGHFARFSRRNLNEKTRDVPDSVRQEVEMIQPIFAQCLRLASYLSMSLSSQNCAAKKAVRLSKVSTLAAAYFRLLLLSMEINLEGCTNDVLDSRLHRYRSLYQNVMGSESPLTEAIGTSDSGLVCFKSISSPIVKRISKCRDVLIATELLDTLSLFALYSDSKESILEMVGISWTALHSEFPGGIEAHHNMGIPWAFAEVLKRLSPNVLIERSYQRTLTVRDTAVRETILKNVLRRSKTSEKSFFQLHWMVRHWSLLALAEKFFPTCADHLHELYLSLDTLVSFAKEIQIPKRPARKYEGSSDDEYVPPKPRQSIVRVPVPESTVPGLGSTSHYAYLHVLLDMTVSSSALFRVKDEPDWLDPLNGPYRELCKIIETFGSLIDLYRTRIYAFPPQTLFHVLNDCRSMLNIVGFQCAECIEWRSKQPTLTPDQVDAGAFDAASVQYLGRIFDVFGIHVIGTLESLCASLIDSSNDLDKTKTNGVTFAPGNLQNVKALRLKINKVFAELEKYAYAHKLSPPRKEAENGQPLRKRRRVEIKGFLQFEESTEESTADLINGPVTELPVYGNHMYSSDLTSNDGSSGDSDSFGADGDWGRQSDEELETEVP